ncbi:autotransporter outer membrane beta-barrel domain-containing protein [Litoreibacter janthinus]|uniref:Autotransporter beta-domain-containing protein n=1 Tax=Litoreibacter janthinus TaxID=670154 RepID=A0A1I6HDI9_9RHOB|nr:autotransporter outer membrane beta-barrel domain-containing protein [Litoreibacter janthinus]SFR52444.1 Autotransporter beta-domain-containing protein [Litoreibacter janthinus]
MTNSPISRQVYLALPILFSSLIAPIAASAQGYPTYGRDPRAEALGAIVGSDLKTFRDAIAQRRGQTGQPSVRQDDTSLTGSSSPSWGGISSAWASVDTKRLSGTYSGNSSNLVFGADAIVGNSLIVGLIGGYNRSSVDLPSGQRVKADGFSVGPYFSARLSDSLSLDGFIGFGKPDYNIDGGQFSGEKTFGNLTLTGSIPLQRAQLSPFISVASVREKLPAFTSVLPIVPYGATEIKSFVATIGTNVNYNPIDKGNLTYLPTAGFEIDYVRNDDGFGNVDSFTTPRLSGGVTIISDTGALNLGANIARTSEGTTTVGASAGYYFQF